MAEKKANGTASTVKKHLSPNLHANVRESPFIPQRMRLTRNNWQVNGAAVSSTDKHFLMVIYAQAHVAKVRWIK